MAAGVNGEKRLLLKSSDGEIFKVDETIAMQSKMIRDMIEKGCASNGVVIPIQDVDAAALSKVLCYCNKHAKPAPTNAAETEPFIQDLKNFDQDLVNANCATLLDLIFAAHYMDVRGLMDLACQAVAEAIEEQCSEEVRRTFYSENQKF
ncbi:hypothetical protein IEQ34_021700 [Dendrobium chrysotoxum]|uniref:SKP1-like protein n=1 Tax=Dendrobium chrysotoxum TaxID=161865 RepID=A0AAV7G6L6_DENCH|nr:hypothetical protein IEQ34_021700 [Dendrobium chrysotoxum]